SGRVVIRIDCKRQRFRKYPDVSHTALVEHSDRNDLRVGRDERNEPGDVCAVAVWTSLLVADFTRIVVVVDEVPTRQQVSRERWVLNIYAGIEHGDLDWTIWPNAAIDLLRDREVDFLRRPLRDEFSGVAADAPGVTDAPGIAAANRRFGDVVGFDEDDARIMRQQVHAIFDGAVVSQAKAVDRAAAELVDWSRAE